jgi:hypothetical protein
MRYCRYIAGFTLLEFMISMTLGLLLVSGAFTLVLAAMKNSEAAMQAQQKQNETLSVMQLLANDMASAGAFGCSRACVNHLHWQGMHGDGSALSVAYQGQPQFPLLQVSENRLHIRVDQDNHFYPNEVLLITQPDEAVRVSVHVGGRGQNLSLNSPLTLKSITGAMVGPEVVHAYFYDAKQKKLQMQSGQGEPLTLLNDVNAFSLTYDVKTAAGVVEKQPDTDDAWNHVCGVNVILTVSGQTWVRYMPVLSHC